jgi:hypothetical protein
MSAKGLSKRSRREELALTSHHRLPLQPEVVELWLNQSQTLSLKSSKRNPRVTRVWMKMKMKTKRRRKDLNEMLTLLTW